MRAPLLLLMSLGLVYLTWSANRSGEITLALGRMITRAGHPRLFSVMLVAQVLLAIFALALAISVLFERKPI